jgi:hypothetical protein
MSLSTRTFLALVASSFVASAALAGPGDFQAGGNGPDKILKAQLGIKGPKTNTCPTEATTAGWVFTNFAGPVQVMIARKGQGVGAPFTIQAKKAANGQYMATFSRKVEIIGPIDAEYRLLVGGGDGVVSNWVPLKANCAIKLPGFGFAPGG